MVTPPPTPLLSHRELKDQKKKKCLKQKVLGVHLRQYPFSEKREYEAGEGEALQKPQLPEIHSASPQLPPKLMVWSQRLIITSSPDTKTQVAGQGGRSSTSSEGDGKRQAGRPLGTFTMPAGGSQKCFGVGRLWFATDHKFH